MSQKVVIVGHGSTSRLGIVRSLSEIDCEITLVVMSFLGSKDNPDKTTPFDCYSRYVSHVYYNYYKDGEGLIRLLIDKCADPEQKGVLLPDSDFSAAVIDNHREMLKDSFI